MKKAVIVILAMLVMSTALMTGVNANADQRVILGYVTQGGGWFTGIAITNIALTRINHMHAGFLHEDGHVEVEGVIDLGPFNPNEIKIYSLEELYGAPLPDDVFSLWIYHLEDDQQFLVNLFIANNLTGIGGYGFQQFTSISFPGW